MDNEPTWGMGLTIGLSGGTSNAIQRIKLMREEGITDLDTIIDYLEKDAKWALRDVDGFDALELLSYANGWKPGRWDEDD